jgi:hypothetical protein
MHFTADKVLRIIKVKEEQMNTHIEMKHNSVTKGIDFSLVIG